MSDPDIMQAEQRFHRVYREIGRILVHKQSQILYDFMRDRSTDCTHYYDRHFHNIVVVIPFQKAWSVSRLHSVSQLTSVISHFYNSHRHIFIFSWTDTAPQCADGVVQFLLSLHACCCVSSRIICSTSGSPTSGSDPSTQFIGISN